MAIEYTWGFPTLDVVYNQDGFTNVVSVVHWTYSAVDGEYSASMYGSVGLPAPGQPFTDFDSLTPDVVQGWVVAALGDEKVAEMTASLAGQINKQKNPVSGSMTPPWAS